jgi:dTDP-4-dehydrorhamnose reductase
MCKKIKVLILGASGFLGGILYRKIKEDTDFWVLGTYYESKKDEDFIKLNVSNFIEVKTFLEHFKPDVIVWCLRAKTNEKELINDGLPNVLNNINQTCKFVFMSTNAVFGEGKGDFSEEDIPSYRNNGSAIASYSNAKIDGEKLVKEHENYIIIRPGAIHGQDINGKWDKRVSQLIEDLTAGKTVVKTTNLFNTFVEVNVLSDAIIKLIEIGYQGVIH